MRVALAAVLTVVLSACYAPEVTEADLVPEEAAPLTSEPNGESEVAEAAAEIVSEDTADPGGDGSSFAGTCHGGPSNGSYCSADSSCSKYCSSGPNAGSYCSADSSCGRWCNKGPNAGSFCSADSSCSKYCSGGTYAGWSCIADSNCPGSYCVQAHCVSTYCVQPLCY